MECLSWGKVFGFALGALEYIQVLTLSPDGLTEEWKKGRTDRLKAEARKST